MGLRILFLLSELIGGDYFMNKISKGWVTLILGPASGLLIILQHPDEANTIIGATYGIIMAIIALWHDIAKDEAANKTQQPTPPVQ